MNIAAFVFAVLGAVMGFIELVIYAGLASFAYGSPDVSDMLATLTALAAIFVSTFYGTRALKRKMLTRSAVVLATCSVLCLLFGGLFFIWAALCWLAAAACAYICAIQSGEGSETSMNQAPTFTSGSPQTAHPASGIYRQSQTNYEPLIGIETTALIKRGKIFLSDDEFAEAERYFEQVLKQDPENPNAYLGKLMAQLGVHNLKELSTTPSPG